MNAGKSPGNDGLSMEYYKEHIYILASVLVKVYQEAIEKGYIPPTFNEALISLILKIYVTDPSNFSTNGNHVARLISKCFHSNSWDAEKAFDKLKWGLLFSALSQLDFDP